MASMKAEIRALDAQVELNACLAAQERSRAENAGLLEKECNESTDLLSS
jgi:hypothetical protein